MSVGLKVGLSGFYLLVTVMLVQELRLAQDRSLLTIGRWVLLYLASVVWPVIWTRHVIGQLGRRNVAVDDRLQFSLFMPAWFAAIAALLALEFARA